jgi:hypothetical protein
MLGLILPRVRKWGNSPRPIYLLFLGPFEFKIQKPGPIEGGLSLSLAGSTCLSLYRKARIALLCSPLAERERDSVPWRGHGDDGERHRLWRGVRGSAQEEGPREPQAPRGDHQSGSSLPAGDGVMGTDSGSSSVDGSPSLPSLPLFPFFAANSRGFFD